MTLVFNDFDIEGDFLTTTLLTDTSTIVGTENNKIVSENLKSKFTNVFSEISNSINKNMNYNEWIELYEKITLWEIELDKYSDENLFLTIKNLKEEANFYFFEFIKKNYQSWLS